MSAEVQHSRKRKHDDDHSEVNGKESKVENGPLKELDEWMDHKRDEIMAKEAAEKKEKQPEEQLEDKSFNPVQPEKKREQFRNYKNSARQKRVEKFYHLQHTLQTYEFVESMEKKYLAKYKEPRSQDKGVWMGIWEALEYLNQIVDDSDPDTNFDQIAHALQTAEAIRKKWPQEEYDWLPLVGLIHDLGKIMAAKDEKQGLSGEPQWAVVGDTFPVGVPFSDKNVFHESFNENPDSKNPKYNQGLGVYKAGCGLFNIKMCWGHDEYLYHVCVQNGGKLPLPALYMIRYHSFYPWHKFATPQEGAYTDLLDAQDKEMFKWVKEFNQFDLYSKADEVPDTQKLRPYYEQLIKKYFPEKLLW
jgi:inositol oxygenase